MSSFHNEPRATKRKLISSQDEAVKNILRSKRSRKPSMPLGSHKVAHLVCLSQSEGHEKELPIRMGEPFVVGRNQAKCSYVILSPVVSHVHFKIHVIQSPSGATLVACQDLSTNGLLLNNHLIKRTSVILMHNDVIKIPRSEAFKCVYARPASIFRKKTLFDPTPPRVPMDKQVGNYMVTSLTLGSGSYAVVNLAYTLKPTECSTALLYQQAACKMIKLGGGPPTDKLMREVGLLRALSHPNINQILDVVVQEDFMNLFLELSTGGDLFAYITTKENGRIHEKETKYCSYQLMLGLQYLHDRNISHRDLKPENILLHTPGPYPRLMIADFGLARPRAYEETLNAVGTICYMPPEAILALQAKSCGYVGIYADAWSLGMVIFVMLCGYNPFDASDIHTLQSCSIGTDVSSGRYDSLTMSRILYSPLNLEHSIWQDMPQAQTLVRGLLEPVPKHRKTIRGALTSEWIQSDIQLLEEMYRKQVEYLNIYLVVKDNLT